MSPTELTAALNNLDAAGAASLSHWGVKTIRAYGASKGWTKADLETLAREEFTRIAKNGLDLAGYLAAPRVGSRFPLSRPVRVAMFAHFASRKAAGMAVA